MLLLFKFQLEYSLIIYSKSEGDRLKMDQQAEQVLSNAIDDTESKGEWERMDVQTGIYPG